MSTITNNKSIQRSNLPISTGIICGLVMAIFLFLFQFTGNDMSPGGKLINYVVLFIGITYALYNLTNHKSSSVFKDGIMAGLKISLIAATIMVISNVLLYIINPEMSFSKYALMPETDIKMFTISAILFFETFVIGNIIAFMNMQYFKNKSRS